MTQLAPIFVKVPDDKALGMTLFRNISIARYLAEIEGLALPISSSWGLCNLFA